MGSGTAVACPQPDLPKLATGGEVLEHRLETLQGYTFETKLLRIPPRPRFYLHLDYGNTEMPEFRRPDGTKIPYAVEPSGIAEFPFVLTLAIDRGRIESASYSFDRFVVDDFVPTSRGAKVEVDGVISEERWEWSFDSDAALFRIDEWYTTERSRLWLGSQDSVVAIYPDGREEVLFGWPRTPPSTPVSNKWWLVFAVPFAAWWFGRRATRSLVAEV